MALARRVCKAPPLEQRPERRLSRGKTSPVKVQERDAPRGAGASLSPLPRPGVAPGAPGGDGVYGSLTTSQPRPRNTRQAAQGSREGGRALELRPLPSRRPGPRRLAVSARDTCRVQCEGWGHTVDPPAASSSLGLSTCFPPEPRERRSERSRQRGPHTASPVGAFRLPGGREAAAGPPTSTASWKRQPVFYPFWTQLRTVTEVAV